MLSVKLTIDGEDLLVQLDDTLLDVLTVSLVWSQLEVELVTLVEVDYLSLERREGSSHATDEDERTIFLCLLNQLLVTIVTFVVSYKEYDKTINLFFVSIVYLVFYYFLLRFLLWMPFTISIRSK